MSNNIPANIMPELLKEERWHTVRPGGFQRVHLGEGKKYLIFSKGLK